MWDVRDEDVQDVGSSGCGMFAGMWNVDLQNAVQEVVKFHYKTP